MCREELLKIPTPEVFRNREIIAITERKEDASVLPKILKQLSLLSIDLSSWLIKIKLMKLFFYKKYFKQF